MIRLIAALALVGGTVHTGEGTPIDSATVLIEGNRIQAVGANVRVPDGAQVIDVRGRIVTPGLIDAATRLGVSDVGLEASSVEATLPKEHDPIRASLRVADTFDSAALTIPIARAGGITSTVVLPAGGLISGQSLWADLTERRPIRRNTLALHVNIRAGRERGGRAAAFLALREAFEDAQLFRGNRGPYISARLRDLSISASDAEVLRRALERKLPVVFDVDRAADIRTVLALSRDFDLKPILLGAAEAWLVADEIARSKVPVLLNPLENLPSGFSSLQSRLENAHILHDTGVTIAFTQSGASHLAHRLRYLAGNAVAEGFPYDDALAAITRNPAHIFGLKDEGTIREGSLANLVVWSGDPFEPSSYAERVFVRGQAVDLETRQDKLTRRYGPRPAIPAGTP